MAGETPSRREATSWKTGSGWLLILTSPFTQAGFCDFSETELASSDISPCWHSFVRYKIVLTGAWSQECSKSRGSLLAGVSGPTYETIDLVTLDDGLDERKTFEEEAVKILAPALTQRRWMARPGFCARHANIPITQDVDTEIDEDMDELDMLDVIGYGRSIYREPSTCVPT